MKPSLLRLLLAALLLPLGGCTRAPAFNVLGSYFPAWMLCIIVGILLAVLLRYLVVRMEWQDFIRPAVVTYPCAAALFTFSLWLIFFS